MTQLRGSRRDPMHSTTDSGLAPRGSDKMTQLLYFAYGSNLSVRQMRARCATARVDARAGLRNHALAFGGFSEGWGGPGAPPRPARGAAVDRLSSVLQPGGLAS